jgi:dimethylhistidine N-methyltransferase
MAWATCRAGSSGADEQTARFAEDVLAGLALPQKAIPAKYFYDTAGSRLFDRICALPEYYPTRTELDILRAHAAEMAEHAGPDAEVVEFGAGSSIKIRILLDALEHPRAFLPIDISGEHLLAAAAELRKSYPDVEILPVTGDFTRSLDLPEVSGAGRRIGFFPGSTIGNFTRDAAEAFLREARTTLGEGSDFIVGVDLKKDRAVLEAAYNDSAGVTAAFDLNLLRRINRELGGTFDLARFVHRAFYNAEEGRIEMHLESLADQSVSVAGRSFAFARGETIHTENSCKYSLAEIAELAGRAGWTVARQWTNAQSLFSVNLLTA